MLLGGGPSRRRQLEVNIAVSDLSGARFIPNAVHYHVVVLATRRVPLEDILPRIDRLMDVMCVLCFCSTLSCQNLLIGEQHCRLYSRL